MKYNSEKDISDCPIHHCKPVHKYITTDRWFGWITYCEKCRILFNKMYMNNSGKYYHFLWSLSQLHPGTESGSISSWNTTAETALEISDPSDVLLFDIGRLEYE